MGCTCSHKRLSHTYIPMIGDNTGRCLAPRCSCTAYQEENE